MLRHNVFTCFFVFSFFLLQLHYSWIFFSRGSYTSTSTKYKCPQWLKDKRLMGNLFYLHVGLIPLWYHGGHLWETSSWGCSENVLNSAGCQRCKWTIFQCRPTGLWCTNNHTCTRTHTQKISLLFLYRSLYWPTDRLSNYSRMRLMNAALLLSAGQLTSANPPPACTPRDSSVVESWASSCVHRPDLTDHILSVSAVTQLFSQVNKQNSSTPTW